MAGLDSDPHGPGEATGNGTTRGAAGMRGAYDTVKEQAGEFAGRATEQGKSMLARQKDTAGERLESVANTLHQTADRLGQDTAPAVGRVVGYAAERLETMGRELKTRDVDALLHDATALARRSPGTFVAGTVVAGFLLSRFLKASAHRHEARGAAMPASSDPVGMPSSPARDDDPWMGLRPADADLQRDPDLRSGVSSTGTVPPASMSTGTGSALDPSGTGAAPWSERDAGSTTDPTREGRHGS